MTIEKNKINNKLSGNYQERESFSKESPPVTPSALTSNNSHSYPTTGSTHNNGNSLNGNSTHNGTQLTDLMEELKMMKSIIIKHETRIRELEKKSAEPKGSNYHSSTGKGSLKSFGNHDTNTFLPDEV